VRTLVDALVALDTAQVPPDDLQRLRQLSEAAPEAATALWRSWPRPVRALLSRSHGFALNHLMASFRAILGVRNSELNGGCRWRRCQIPRSGSARRAYVSRL